MGVGNVDLMGIVLEDGVTTVVVRAGGDTAEEWVAGAREGGEVNIIDGWRRRECGCEL